MGGGGQASAASTSAAILAHPGDVGKVKSDGLEIAHYSGTIQQRSPPILVNAVKTLRVHATSRRSKWRLLSYQLVLPAPIAAGASTSQPCRVALGPLSLKPLAPDQACAADSGYTVVPSAICLP